MIIDCHTHIKSGDVYRREFRAKTLVSQMDEAGIEKSLTFSICLPSRESNDFTKARVRGYEDRLIPLGHIMVSKPDQANTELKRVLGEWRWKGVKIHWGETPRLDIEAMKIILEKIEEYAVPLLLDTAYRAETAMKLIRNFPKVNFVIAHFGAPRNESLMMEWADFARKSKNCYLDTSYCHTPWCMKRAIRTAGARKILFGSDGPLVHPLIEMAKIKACHLRPWEEELVFSRNTLRLFKIS